jgi:plasmid stabilization system protein ParE
LPVDAKLVVHPAFYRRVRHYRNRMTRDGRPQAPARFVEATQECVLRLMENPQRGHSARFDSADLSDILRVPVPGFSVFAVFYRWNGRTLTVITLEHTAQDLPSRVADVLSAG